MPLWLPAPLIGFLSLWDSAYDRYAAVRRLSSYAFDLRIEFYDLVAGTCQACPDPRLDSGLAPATPSLPERFHVCSFWLISPGVRIQLCLPAAMEWSL